MVIRLYASEALNSLLKPKAAGLGKKCKLCMNNIFISMHNDVCIIMNV